MSLSLPEKAPPKLLMREEFSASRELEVLHCTSKREFLIDQLRTQGEAMRSAYQWDPCKVVTTLLLTRQASLDCLEVIYRWRNSTTAGEEFPWDDGKTNYLLKMCRDLDFIRSMPTLKQFGFRESALCIDERRACLLACLPASFNSLAPPLP